MASIVKSEPVLEASTSPAPPPAAADRVKEPAVPPADGGKLDQLSRVEDKTARIEEKFARSEERMMRVESALEKATLRLEGATQDMNLQGVRDDLARLRDSVRRKPGSATVFVIALVSAILGAALCYGLMRYGVPGLLPAVIPTVTPQ